MKDSLRIALVQGNPVVGDIEANTQSIIKHIEANQSADLVVFPECYVTGYPLFDLVLRPGFLREVDDAVSKIRNAVIERQGPAVIFGAPMAGTKLPYNAAYFIEPSGSMRTVRKAELPNSDVFDERRTFASATVEDNAPITYKGFGLGVQICEDMWHGRVSRHLADEFADILIVINGSPYHRGKDAERKKIARTRVNATGLPLIYLNMVGGQDEMIFDGGSFAMNHDLATFTARAFGHDTLHAILRRDGDGRVRIEADVDTEFASYPTDPMEADYRACVLGLHDYIAKTGSKKVFVGVSGGLDSALVLAMAVDAIGAENVTGIMMPSSFTGDESLGLADDLMERLGVTRMVVPIESTFDDAENQLLKAMSDLGDEFPVGMPNFGIMSENLQSRIRGMFLMGMTNALGGIVLSTGNKSEMAVGYATLYGDMNGGFNPMKSVYKSEAFAMAEWRNKAYPELISDYAVANPIPQQIITRPPSAELSAGQEDANTLGEYAALDTVLKGLIEQKLSVPEATKLLIETFSAEDLKDMTARLSPEEYTRKIARLVRNAQYKRVQSPPGVKLHPTDFGLGWRYPIAGNYTL